jgi:magnesium-transporting ATPase (P-type)
MTGPALSALEKYANETEQHYGAILRDVCPYVTLFARVSPNQKESIVIGE